MKKELILVSMLGFLGIAGVMSTIVLLSINYDDKNTDNNTEVIPTVSSNTYNTSDNYYTTPTTSPNNDDTQASSNNYKDGTYKASTDYVTHGHQESITVEITIANGKVTKLSNIHSGNDQRSVSYQNNFESSIESYVVGKNIDDISLSRIGGASDTTAAFMDSIYEIKLDAEI